MEYYQLSIIAGIILIIIEMITLTFIFLGFGIGAFAVSMIQFLLDDFLIGRDSIVFAVTSLISIVIFRKLFKSNSDQKKLMEEDVNQY